MKLLKNCSAASLKRLLAIITAINEDAYAIYSSFLMMRKLLTDFIDFVTVDLAVDLQIKRDAYLRQQVLSETGCRLASNRSVVYFTQ